MVEEIGTVVEVLDALGVGLLVVAEVVLGLVVVVSGAVIVVVVCLVVV